MTDQDKLKIINELLEDHKEDIEALKSGAEPPCMDSHTDTACMFLDLLERLSK